MDDILSHIEDKYEYKKFLDANAWSTYLKTSTEALERTNFSIDILLLSEINIRQAELPLYCIDGYDMHGFTIENRRGGGLLVYSKNELRLQTVNPQSCGLEILHSQFKSSDTTIRIITVYKPPNTNKLRCIQELSVLIKQIPEYEDSLLQVI
ncbi:unnamed protein product [Parnassius apollo]|uniref:(apollo) hypothetical protein n=1 Tax=Parnassius apollo TaxID=110799 RepID=A0A8S3W705_PARAO|nr:unnamed protein product [Parnassius apollo]